jgi:two-component system CheB/CheR fusion protein
LKLDVISRAHGDLQNLMAVTDVGTLFLDPSLRIKRFTKQVTDLFSITPADEGRPITDFTHQLEYDDLIKDARAVLAELAPVRREVRSRNGRWYETRLRPYRSADDKVDGVVITLLDVTERREVEQALRDSEQRLRREKRLVELARDPIFIWDFEDGILEWNRGSEELYGYSRDEALGKRKDQLLATVVPDSSFAALRAKLLEEGSWRGELKHRTKDGRELTVETRIQLQTVDGRRLVLESTRDVTERKLWEQRQRLLLGELSHRVKNTLAVVQAIAHRTLRDSASTEDFVERFDGRLLALAGAHNLLIKSDWQGADLSELARTQLEPYTSANPDRLRLQGEPVLLTADIATPFGLVLHELATNAAKHGALSREQGTVNVSWRISDRNNQSVLTVVWREKGGPPVKQPTASGLGSKLIDHAIPGAKISREFQTDGLVCAMELPLPAADGTIVGMGPQS